MGRCSIRLVSWRVVAALACLGVACALAPAADAASQRFASPTGAGSACTQPSPCDIQTAVEDVSVMDGDEVILLPGSYDVGADDVDLFKAITVHGQEGQPRPTVSAT